MGALCVLSILWAVGSAGAVSFIQIHPSVVEISAVPGRTTKGSLVIQNPGAEDLPVAIEVKDGWAQQIGHPSSVPPAEWLFLKIPKKLVVRPYSSRSIPYKIKVPPTLSGEVLALVYFSGPSEQGGGQTGVQLRHGIPIYLSAKGTGQVTLTAADARASIPPKGGLEFSVALVSDGNIHVRPRGEWVVTDFFGGETERIPMGYGSPVFPGARNTYYATAKRMDWAPGKYKAALEVTYGDNFEPVKKINKVYALDVSEGKVSLTEEVGDAH